MRRRYRIAPEARPDLHSIWHFIARDDPEAASRVTERLEAACRLLARFQRTGHKQRNDVRTSEPVLFWTAGSYVVVYRAEPPPVLILRIVQGARDLDALI